MNTNGSDVLFTIKKENLETGLRGVPVGYCTTSSVNATKGLFYHDKPVSAMSSHTPEQVIYFLFHGKEGSNQEIAHFAAELEKRSICSPEVFKHIQQLPKEGDPMKLFCSALLIAGMVEGTGNYREDCLNIIAKIPSITACVINYHAGWKQGAQQPKLGYIENFLHMLGVQNVDRDHLLKVLKLFSILHFDHGGGNLSTFIGKAVASSLEDMYGSMCAAMCALAGPRHGRANRDSLELVEEIVNSIGDDASEERLEAWLRERIASGKLVFGFGHAVLRVEDPRATIFYEKAQMYFPNHPLVKISTKLRTVGSKILKENPKIADPYPNVDAVSGVLLAASGFNYPEYFTVLFGMARVVGIALQIVYERCEARGGKGTPIIRPSYIYKKREDISK